MQKKKLFALGLAFCLSVGFSLPVFAAGSFPQDAACAESSPRFQYVMTASVGLDVSSSGAVYSVSIIGTGSVSRITGTLTLYKGNSTVDSVSLQGSGTSLIRGGTLNTDGPGNYRLEFAGTVYADGGSEPLSLEITDSY